VRSARLGCEGHRKSLPGDASKGRRLRQEVYARKTSPARKSGGKLPGAI